MAAEINDLFEEGITRCQELVDAAEGAMTAIDAMATRAEDLARQLEDESGEACQHMRNLVARLARAEGELETSGSQAEGALQGLAGRAGELKEEAGQLLERATKGLDELETRHDVLDAALEADMASTTKAFQDLAQKTQEAQAQVEHQLQEAAQAIASFRGAVQSTRAGFLQNLQQWAAAAQGLGQTAHDQGAAWVHALGDLLGRQAAAMKQTASALVDTHNATMEALKHRFVEGAPQELAAALEPLRGALEALGAGAAESEQRLSSSAKDLEQWAVQVLPSFGPIQGSLDSTARLE